VNSGHLQGRPRMNPRGTTGLYDRREDDISLDEVGGL
jgi:hypothetical protein